MAKGTSSHECACGYPATSAQDLDDHIAAMMSVFDGSHHA
jgi:hypothetical protein